ncbi:MAG: helix-turn-helix domain-containing protein, partial [Fibrobacteres bacterium]|nr:helix-turn-helix domain-containing protein [Fibrobacterota bacterium]
LIVEGEAFYEENGIRKCMLSRGDVLLIPPNVTHIFECLLDKECIISCIHFSFSSDFSPSYLVSRCGLNPVTPSIFRTIASEFIQRTDESIPLMLSLLNSILLLFKRGLHKNGQEIPAKVKQTIAFMESRYSEDLGRDSLAAYVDVTPEYLSALFKRSLGRSPIEVLTDIRIRKASEFLRKPGINVSQAAFMSGYADPLYFSRIFKKQTGVSPSEFARGV